MQLALFSNWEKPVCQRKVSRRKIHVQILTNLDETGIMQSYILFDEFHSLRTLSKHTKDIINFFLLP